MESLLFVLFSFPVQIQPDKETDRPGYSAENIHAKLNRVRYPVLVDGVVYCHEYPDYGTNTVKNDRKFIHIFFHDVTSPSIIVNLTQYFFNQVFKKLISDGNKIFSGTIYVPNAFIH